MIFACSTWATIGALDSEANTVAFRLATFGSLILHKNTNDHHHANNFKQVHLQKRIRIQHGTHSTPSNSDCIINAIFGTPFALIRVVQDVALCKDVRRCYWLHGMEILARAKVFKQLKALNNYFDGCRPSWCFQDGKKGDRYRSNVLNLVHVLIPHVLIPRR
jgi:hypothetical protein